MAMTHMVDLIGKQQTTKALLIHQKEMNWHMGHSLLNKINKMAQVGRIKQLRYQQLVQAQDWELIAISMIICFRANQPVSFLYREPGHVSKILMSIKVKLTVFKITIIQITMEADMPWE
jgi:hypothetical protein